MPPRRRRLPMLEVNDLTVAYGPVVALHGVSLTVADGSMTAVLGANGAGKTTLVRTISGLTRPRGGSVRLDGRDITRLAPDGLARLVLVQIMARIRALVTERGLTVLLIEQNAKSALSVADEGIVLHLGKVVARGRAQHLLSEERLRHAYLGF